MKCAREDSNFHDQKRSLGPQPNASTNSATCAEKEIIKIKKVKQSGLTFFGDLAGARTQDPLLKREMLYQLSYQVKYFL